MRLRIPVQATSLAADNGRLPRTTVTRAAVLELLALLKECQVACADHRGQPGTASPLA